MTRVLVFDDLAPVSARDGSSHRMVTLLQLLIELGYDVDFAPTWGWSAPGGGAVEDLTNLGVGVLGLTDPIERIVAEHAPDYGIVVLSRLATASRLLEHVRRAAPEAYLVYDAVFLSHLNSYRLAKRLGNVSLLQRALRERRDEIAVVNSVDAVIAVTDDDARLIREYGTSGPIGVVTAAHMDPVPERLERHERADAVFVGFLRNPDNHHAARRLVDGVWPEVARRMPGQLLHLVGAEAPPWLGTPAPPWLRMHGQVPDVDLMLRRAAVSPMPIEGGTGIKTKVLQCFATGTPVVGSDDALGGIPAVHGSHVLRAESDDEFVHAVVQVLEDSDLWARLSAGGARLLSARFGREAALAGLRTALAVTR